MKTPGMGDVAKGSTMESTKTPTANQAQAPSDNLHTISIEGMTGDVCVQKVKAALAGTPGVTAESVEVGCATISCAKTEQCMAACAAISAAGYKAKVKADSKGSCDMASEGAGGAIADSAKKQCENPPKVHVVKPGESVAAAAANHS